MSRLVAAAAMVLMLILTAARGMMAKTTIELCVGADACLALLSYTLYTDMKVSQVVALFGANPAALLVTNTLDFASPGAANRILPTGFTLRVPICYTYVDGVCKSVSVRYATYPAHTVASVVNVVFVGLASTNQIRNANGIAFEDPNMPLDLGQTLIIPLPYVCFNSTDNNLLAVYM